MSTLIRGFGGGGVGGIKYIVIQIQTTSTGSSNAAINIITKIFDKDFNILSSNTVNKVYNTLPYSNDYVRLTYLNGQYSLFPLKKALFNGNIINANSMAMSWGYGTNVTLGILVQTK